MCFGAKDPEIIKVPTTHFQPMPTYEERAARAQQAGAVEQTTAPATALGSSLGTGTGTMGAGGKAAPKGGM